MNSDPAAFQKQVMGVSVSFVFMIFFSLVDYHWLMKLDWLIYLAGTGILVATRYLGTSAGTAARRWLNIGPIQIQPSEFTKIAMILFFAFLFHKLKEKINSPLWLGASLVLIGIPAYLILDQPNLSTCLVVLVVFVLMVYVAKISYKWVFGVIAACIPVVVALGIYLKQQGDLWLSTGNPPEIYQVRRILAWLGPDKFPARDLTLQQDNSVMAIGSGQLYGKGLYNTSLESVKNGQFLMEEDTDFIFAVIGEELGFAGSCVIIALLTLIALDCIYLASRSKDMCGRLICAGMGGLIAFQAFVNIGVATRILPNTGIPLPFVSAGLSSLLSLFIGIGIVLNVGMQRKGD